MGATSPLMSSPADPSPVRPDEPGGPAQPAGDCSSHGRIVSFGLMRSMDNGLVVRARTHTHRTLFTIENKYLTVMTLLSWWFLMCAILLGVVVSKRGCR